MSPIWDVQPSKSPSPTHRSTPLTLRVKGPHHHAASKVAKFEGQKWFLIWKMLVSIAEIYYRILMFIMCWINLYPSGWKIEWLTSAAWQKTSWTWRGWSHRTKIPTCKSWPNMSEWCHCVLEQGNNWACILRAQFRYNSSNCSGSVVLINSILECLLRLCCMLFEFFTIGINHPR